MKNSNEISNKVFNSVRWTSLSTLTLAFLQFIQIIILSRFLTPQELGLFAIIMLVVNFNQMFSDFGISNAIIHKQNISQEQLNSLYWLNILIALVIYSILFLTSPYISMFYNEPLLEKLIVISCFSIVIQSLGKQYMVIFEKRLEFELLAKIKIFSSILSFILIIILLFLNFSIYSVVYSLIFYNFLLSSFFIYHGRKNYKIKFYLRFKDLKDFFSFGFYQTSSGIVNYINSQIDIIIIGKLLGSEALGIYNVIKQIVEAPAKIINPIVTKVTFPTMSLLQNNNEKVKNIYLKTINYISSINFPIYAFIILFGNEIIVIAFGPDWIQHAIILKILAFYFLIRSTGNPIGSLVLAKGKPKYEMYWNIGLMIYIPFIIYFAASISLLYVTWSWVFIFVSLMIPNWYFLVNKLCMANFVEYFKEILKPFLITLIAFIISYLLIQFTDILFLKLLLSISMGLIILIILNYKFNKSFYNTLKTLLRFKG